MCSPYYSINRSINNGDLQMTNQWIKNTGTQPVGDGSTEAAFKYRDGSIVRGRFGNIAWWTLGGNSYDVIEYRLIEPKQECLSEAGTFTKEQRDNLKPIAQNKQEWNGEGWPPVGCECEYRPTEQASWAKVKVLATAGDYFWLGYPDDKLSDGPDTHHKTGEFRPLQTKADIEREAATLELSLLIRETVGLSELCEAIIDAGYRKVKELGDEDIANHILTYGNLPKPEVVWGKGAKWARDYILGKNNG